MDIALCVIDKALQVVEYAGAKNPIIYIQNEQLLEVKADKIPIGGDFKDNGERIFTNTVLTLSQKPTMFYLFTDGFQDQFGGEENRKFGLKRMKALFQDIYTKDAVTQGQILEETINNWRQKERQIDDILLLGFRI
jgi:serine phosphatase RsbU (regulator of sigma subunit)